MLPAASIVLLVLSDAFAGPPAAVDAVTPERAGIAHAKEAGMYVDPAVEEMMARAPIGSCANDPTLAKCPSAHAIVLVEPAEVSGPAAPTSGVGTTGAQTFAPLVPSSRDATGTSATTARAAAAVSDQCGVHVSPDSPRRSLLRARMDAQNY